MEEALPGELTRRQAEVLAQLLERRLRQLQGAAERRRERRMAVFERARMNTDPVSVTVQEPPDTPPSTPPPPAALVYDEPPALEYAAPLALPAPSAPAPAIPSQLPQLLSNMPLVPYQRRKRPADEEASDEPTTKVMSVYHLW